MTTRKRCANEKCQLLFDAREGFETLCVPCASKEYDLAMAMITQDNGDAPEWLRPRDALTLVQARVELARQASELRRWQQAARHLHAGLTAISVRGMFPREQRQIALTHLGILQDDLPEIAEEIEGPVDTRKRG